MITLYGIPNCDTVKKARRWLDENNLPYNFHNYKNEGISQEKLEAWCRQSSLDVLLNRRGTTWRKLDSSLTDNLDTAGAIKLMTQETSLIKRPVLEKGKTLLVGFNPEQYQTLL